MSGVGDTPWGPNVSPTLAAALPLPAGHLLSLQGLGHPVCPSALEMDGAEPLTSSLPQFPQGCSSGEEGGASGMLKPPDVPRAELGTPTFNLVLGSPLLYRSFVMRYQVKLL